jgi:hypothetical protein
MVDGLTDKIGAQCQNETDVRRRALSRVWECRDKRLDEAVPQTLAVNESKSFFELIGDEENALTRVRCTTFSDDVHKRNVAGSQAVRKLLGTRHPIHYVVVAE